MPPVEKASLSAYEEPPYIPVKLSTAEPSNPFSRSQCDDIPQKLVFSHQMEIVAGITSIVITYHVNHHNYLL